MDEDAGSVLAPLVCGFSGLREVGHVAGNRGGSGVISLICVASKIVSAEGVGRP